MEKTLAQTKRILRKNGILVVMACSRSIINDAIWFSQIHPDITDKLSKINPSVKQYIALFSKHGFKCVSAMNLIPTTSIFDDRLNPEGPLNEDWRIGTSMFQLAGPEKEKEMVQFVLDMKDKGTLEQFVSDHDRTTEIGEMTLFVCISV